ncbi:MAG: hypothetical protein EA400_05345 [Chromatiaceae bacterium]|nr:MAG: hypothetical protein EA400_05345 [Chromatiaceae bacterium]
MFGSREQLLPTGESGECITHIGAADRPLKGLLQVMAQVPMVRGRDTEHQQVRVGARGSR